MAALKVKYFRKNPMRNNHHNHHHHSHPHHNQLMQMCRCTWINTNIRNTIVKSIINCNYKKMNYFKIMYESLPFRITWIISYYLLFIKLLIVFNCCAMVAKHMCVTAEHVRELEVSEGVAIGYRIGYIGEFLSDSHISPPYLIVPVPGSAVNSDLLIDHTTGEVRTKILLDREKRSSYSFVAIPLSGENIRVIVRVLDENDNAPMFPVPMMHIEFPENTPRDVKRTLNPAKDLDLGRFNTQRYNIVSGNVNNAFRLSSHRERDGVLYLDLQINGFLDRETIPSYSLVIEALDGGSPPLRGQMTVNITIQDVNDNQPIFNQSRYFASVPENATVGTNVLKVYATDTDAGDNGRVQYSINRRQSDKEHMFRIDSETGLIVVNKPLDFETKELHELVVVARDQGEQPLETTAFVSIRVTDVNDNQPTINVIFLSDDATPKISESALPGEFVARISVNDPDSKTEYSNVNVSLIGGDGHFGLQTHDNIIYLVIVSKPLDREIQSNYTLNVIATDTGNPPLHASKTIYLKVTDINDNAPEFEHPVYRANVMEIADPGTSVIQVIAIDRDEGNNSAITYTLLDTPDTHSQWFQIDQHTGLITTRTHIDCETEPVPQLTVIAQDNGNSPLSSTATVLVTIHDVNDNEPIFDQSFYNVSVSEMELKGRCILKVSASDPDCGVNAIVNYTLGEGSRKFNEFEIRSNTGEICISSELDYETRNSYEFPIIATDRGGLSTTAMVKIQITDINDNRPIFYPREYNVSLRENGQISSTPILAVVATDPDSGHFGDVSYRIVAGNEAAIFRIDRITGELFVARSNMLSSRTQPYLKLNISATDGGGQRALADAEIYISVIDSSQRPPIFEKSRYNYSVKEDIGRGTVVGAVLATNNNLGNRGAVRYSIYSGDPDGYFSIDAINGNIRIANTLDHETKPQVLLNIQATSGDPPAYGHTQVNIDIEDVNDNPPEFESNTVRISVPENVDLGVPLYAANAIDKDSGKNGIVTYRLVNFRSSPSTIQQQQSIISSASPSLSPSSPSSSNLFSIDSRTGHLTLLHNLDYEQSNRHTLIITATDSGDPPLSANLTILVEVQDVNDNIPIFQNTNYSVRVIESTPINSQILQVTAIDDDVGNNARLTYRIVSTGLDSNQYHQHVHELRKYFNEKSLATPTNNKSLLLFHEEENHLNDITQPFGIFPNSGVLYLRSALDRETYDHYNITVTASDNGTPSATATAQVLVYVLDANDNDPQFVQSNYEFMIEENLRRGAVVGKLYATDADLDGNASIRYSLIPSNTSFHINPVTGEIITREPLDREQRENYDLVAEARDQGSPYRSSRVTVRVTVTDVNDNAPDIVDPQEDVVSVREEQPPGTDVVRVRAIDRDNGYNASILYSILKGRDSDGYDLFTIDTQTGLIKTRVTLDHEERTIYSLAVAATDNGKPQKQTVRLLRVEVLDLNDNRPTFTSSSLVFKIREDVPIGYIIGSINGGIQTTTTSTDFIEQYEYNNYLTINTNSIGGSNGGNGRSFHSGQTNNLFGNNYNDNLHITYTLNSLTVDVLDGSFDMDRNMGALIVARRLDREQQNEYRLEIRALDTTSTNNPQSSAVTVKIEIDDVNDNAPVWPVDPIVVNVLENTVVGTIIYNFTATDDDAGVNGMVQYRLQKQMPNEKQIFTVDPLTGALSVLDQIDYEELTEYLLVVEAIDQSHNISERLGTGVTVRIQIIDVNDNVPMFITPSIQDSLLVLSDTITVGQIVTHIVAIDKDAGDNGRISYSILSGNEDGRFIIASDTGYIELAKPLIGFDTDIHSNYVNGGGGGGLSQTGHNLLNNGKYTLMISASDHGIPVPKVSRISMHIIIQGSTNNPPRFLESVYHVNISENISIGSFVIRVGAKSFQSDNGGGNLTFEIPLGVADDHFIVDPVRGIVTTKGQFDRELKDFYTVPVYVLESPLVYQHNQGFTQSSQISGQHRQSLMPAAVILNKNINNDHHPYQSNNINNNNNNNNNQNRNVQFDVTTIVVRVTDINDHAPEFRPGSCYPLAVPENSDLSIIHTVVATDLDEDANGDIIYSITGGNVGNKFSIDMHTGELTARPLDRESHSRYILQITAQDRGTPISHQGTCNISVIVEDQNDNDPRFELSKYIATIAEDVPIGTSVLTVKAIDADLGINARIIYSLANETQWLFNIDNQSGLVTTAGILDREQQHIYEFMVVATDGGRYDARSQRVPIQINIDDVNDNKPIFDKYPFKGKVPSLIQPGQILLQIQAMDADQGTNGEIVYSLINDTTNGKFRLNPNTGTLSATQSLASENGRLLHLEIMASDKGNPPQNSVGLIELRIGDVPIGTPTLYFQNDTYRVQIMENTLAGASVIQLNAVRSDGRRQKILYTIGSGNDGDAFTIDSQTGEIKVKHSDKLDYEQYNNDRNNKNEIKLIAVARTDGGGGGGGMPILYGYCELYIKLQDENDNAPRFTQQQYSAAVWEGNNKGTFVMQVKAYDIDQGANARVLYHIVDGNHDNAFIIEPAFSGVVKTNIVLDREIRDTYRLKVIATDEGVPQMTGTSVIRVHIVDINDNQPTFPPHSVISVSEGIEIGTVLTTISANDVDTNPALTYTFSDENLDDDIEKIFAIDRFSGKIILKKHLDYEMRQEYQLHIIASDTAHKAHTTLTIRVTDINDNAPVFQQPAYHAALPDKVTNTDLELMTVNATDADSGMNADIHYSIVTPVNGFSVGETNGILYVNTSRIVIKPSKDDIQLTIAATDSGLPPLSSVTTVRIHVNTNAQLKPQFLQNQYRATINEDAPRGTIILKLFNDILDVDLMQNILFEIVAGNDGDVFEITQPNSYVALVKSLDREKIDSYNLRLVTTERGVPARKDDNTTAINIYVTVDDANDNAPIFQLQPSSTASGAAAYEQTISESIGVRQQIHQFLAIDDDLQSSVNSEVTYDITSGNDLRMFSIDLITGILSVNNELDCDLGPSEYHLIIKACDSGVIPKCTLCPYHLRITDENDNEPRFPISEYLEYVGENEPIGTSIFTVHATDLDKGEFGKLNYSIISSSQHMTMMMMNNNNNNNGGIIYNSNKSTNDLLLSDEDGWEKFKVDPQTGLITSNAIFDYEQRNRYVFQLRAMDIGGKQATVKVRIMIESRDEYSPQFTERTYRFVLGGATFASSGTLPIGYVIGRVTATDRDKGPDGRVVYQLTNAHPYFKVNRTTGAVMIKRKLDNSFDATLDAGRDISLVITASSGRQGSLTNMTVVEISLDPLADLGTNQASSIAGGDGNANNNILNNNNINNNNTNADSTGLADWALGLMITLILIVLACAAVFLFLHMKNRRHKHITKPSLSNESIGGGGGGGANTNSNSYVDPSAFDTIPIRGNGNLLSGVGIGGSSTGGGRTNAGNSGANSGMGNSNNNGQFAPPKYDEIPQYGGHPASSSGAATTSELSGSEQSGSSGRGSAEDGEDGEDEEIRMINEGPMQRDGVLHRNGGAGGGGGGGGAGGSDDGRLSDVSVHNTQEYLARLGIVDNPNTIGATSTSSRHCSESMGVGSQKDVSMLHHHTMPLVDSLHNMFDEESAENDITNLIYAKLNDVNVVSGVGSGGSSINNNNNNMDRMVGGVNGGGGNNNGSVTGGMSGINNSNNNNNINNNNGSVVGGNVIGSGSSDRGSSTDEAATTTGSISAAVDHVMVMGGFGDHPVVGGGNTGPSMNGSLSSIVHSEEELTGSYNWDYLLDWGPQYQPLAHVFSEIARLKDDTLSVHSGNSGTSSAKSKAGSLPIHSVKHIPPPLLTNIAPRTIPILSARGNLQHHQQQSGNHQYLLPRSPISHDTNGGFNTSSAMSPSFSPSLSPLATRSPSISPHVASHGGGGGGGGGGPGSVSSGHHMVSLPRHQQQQQQHHQQLQHQQQQHHQQQQQQQQQQQPQPLQRKTLDTDIRIRM